ncbi:hypothetical protein TSH58p_17485 [Azospirillum sp. TSH58]|nr:hypothetical protein TSH58p_17485 [Azospirillum sp. TSH58]PWC80831.1 hypothetical protein TSH58_00890 [Azospirillum sp. TSH58]
MPKNPLPLRRPSLPPTRPLDSFSPRTRTDVALDRLSQPCPLVPRVFAANGFLRDRLHFLLGIQPQGEMSDAAVDATVRLNGRRVS